MHALFLIAGCIESGGVPSSKPDTGTTDTGYIPYYTPPTTDTDGDLDDDGYTPEQGDCDDDDVTISPAIPEDAGDGEDNDCDGRIDEEWTGVNVVFTDSAGDYEILILDTVGREAEDAVTVEDECYPNFLDTYGDGWVASTGTHVVYIDADGDCTELADFSDTDVYEFGVYGVATTPDGRIFATTVDALWEIDVSGNVEKAAEWVCNFDDPDAHEAAITGLAWSRSTNTLGLFDYYGGFATWSDDTGFQAYLKGDILYPALYTFTGASQDGGPFFAPGGDAETGAYGLYAFDLATASWSLKMGWSEPEWDPAMLAMNSDNGDGYITANGAQVQTVWRLNVATGAQDDLYYNDIPSPTRSFAGIVSTYSDQE